MRKRFIVGILAVSLSLCSCGSQTSNDVLDNQEIEETVVNKADGKNDGKNKMESDEEQEKEDRQKQAQRQLYNTYKDAESCFSENDIEGGFSLLDTLQSDYRNIQKIYDSYERLKDTKFNGRYREGSVGEVSQAIIFELKYSSYDHIFELHVNKQIYWSDGTVYKEHDFYIDPDDIENEDTINYDSYTWTINEEGQLTEVDKGGTYLYN